MTARIYHHAGSWRSIQTDPSGGEIRCRYPNGQAAMIALDPRNRSKAQRLERMAELIAAANRTFARAEAARRGHCVPLDIQARKDCE